MTEQTYTKVQACQILKISLATLTRRMRTGAISFKKIVARRGQESVFFTRDDLGLPPPKLPKPQVVAAPIDIVAPIVAFGDNPEANLEGWRQGTILDSSGNAAFGKPNQDGSTSEPRGLVPKVEVDVGAEHRARMDGTSHMHSALVGSTAGPSGNTSYLNSLEYQRDHGGITAQQYDDLMSASAKARKLSSQTNKKCVDEATIRESFKHGYSR